MMNQRCSVPGVPVQPATIRQKLPTKQDSRKLSYFLLTNTFHEIFLEPGTPIGTILADGKLARPTTTEGSTAPACALPTASGSNATPRPTVPSKPEAASAPEQMSKPEGSDSSINSNKAVSIGVGVGVGLGLGLGRLILLVVRGLFRTLRREQYQVNNSDAQPASDVELENVASDYGPVAMDATSPPPAELHSQHVASELEGSAPRFEL
ncbi:hypothetical protein AJ79_08748 [Helicocarpus griseus UAMH5409]|uniref:Mid2 domain-containing protein n=1 Tax=Helicocarpus griseus UAMH5409 TaxID=1447875 RepID=A0A2B7WQG7_9EURO|nr:hypothetical protein AJ79_08748 [Helicocarpus griseus UAMH5409]